MDRTHISMSVANTSFQDPFGDISFASDGSGTFGAFSGGFHADSALKPAHGQVRMQTPYARKGRFGYTDEEDEDENGRSVNSSVVTPLWGREGLSTLSSGGRSDDVSSSRLGGHFSSSGNRDRENASTTGDSYHPNNGQRNRMMFPTSGSAESHFDRGTGGEAFDQLVSTQPNDRNNRYH